jgi:glycosyltransferase involved in cell wall biosynthesis
MEKSEGNDWARRCVAVIPCLNEEAAIGKLVAEVRLHTPSVVVVDDGSSDRTGAVARESGATVLRNDLSRGKGVSLRAGWHEAKAKGAAWALSLDGDGQHLPEDIPGFFDCAASTGAALVIGNRMSDTRAMPWLRRRVNLWMSRRISAMAGRSLPDTQCGFRLMHLEAWSELRLSAEHFEIESEVLLAFLAAGHRVEFVPIRTIYKGEQSKIHPVRDTLRWFKWWRKARSSRNAAVRPTVRR